MDPAADLVRLRVDPVDVAAVRLGRPDRAGAVGHVPDLVAHRDPLGRPSCARGRRGSRSSSRSRRPRRCRRRSRRRTGRRRRRPSRVTVFVAGSMRASVPAAADADPDAAEARRSPSRGRRPCRSSPRPARSRPRRARRRRSPRRRRCCCRRPRSVSSEPLSDRVDGMQARGRLATVKVHIGTDFVDQSSQARELLVELDRSAPETLSSSSRASSAARCAPAA